MAVIVPIIADTSGFTRALGKSQGGLARFGKTAAFVAGAAALGGLVATLRVGVSEFMDQQKVAAQTNAVLKSTGSIAKVTAQEMNQLSESLMRKSGVDDEAIQSSQNLLLTFTQIRNETGKGNDIFDQATKATLDLSVAMGKDLNSSAILVGKALNDPVKGATALSRAGVQLTEGQKNQIKAFVESGRVLEAQKIILGELTTQFGGSAEAAGKTLPGQLNILKQTFNNLAGELAAKFLPGVARAAQALIDFLGKFSAAPTLDAKVRVIIGGIVDATGRVFRDLYNWWTTTQRTELPARVLITPSGRQQFDAFFSGIEADARAAGKRMGLSMIGAIVGVFTSEGRSRIASSAQSIADSFGGAAQIWFRLTGTTLIQSLVGGALEAIPEAFSRIGPAIKQALLKSITDVRDALPRPLRDAVDSAMRQVRKAPARNLITDTVKQATQDARRQLQSLGSSITGFLAQRRQASFRVGGTGANAAEITAEQRRIEDARFAIEEAAAREALASAEDTTQARLDLDELLLNRTQQLRERALQDAEETDRRTIDNLIEEFNRGLIGAQTFAQRLQDYVGADFGTELGLAFSGAFSREVQNALSLAQDLARAANLPITAEQPTPVTSAIKSENQRRYDEALKDWNDDQARLRDLREKLKKGEITQQTLNNFINRQNPNRPKPKRSAYGLAMGGILKQQVFTAGEAGPEAVLPLRGKGAAMLREALGSQGGANVTTYNLTVNAGMGTDPDELGRVIVESIKRFEKRNGQAFSAPLLSVTQNVAGQTATGSAKTDFNRVTTLRKG